MNEHNYRKLVINTFVIAMVIGGIGFSYKKAHAQKSGDVPTLLYMRSDSSDPQAINITQCDKLTIKEYTNHNIRVLPIMPEDFKKWLEGAGKNYAKAHENLQHLAFAKAQHADAIGGINIIKITEEDAKDSPFEAGTQFYGWGLSLNAILHDNSMNFQTAEKVQAISLRLSENNPWGIDTTVTRNACGQTEDEANTPSPNIGRPFMGISLDDRKVSTIFKNSPAEKSGLKVDDEIISLAGKEIQNISDVAKAMKDFKAGDKIDVTYRHDGKIINKNIQLADYHELVEVQYSPVGKTLPDLVGKDINGKEIRLKDYRGKVVLLDYWATWCSPCIDELPLLQLLRERITDKNFVLIAVSVDEDVKTWENFVKNNHLTGIQLNNPQWGIDMNISGYPTILLVDTGGVVQCNLRGKAIAQAVMTALDNH